VQTDVNNAFSNGTPPRVPLPAAALPVRFFHSVNRTKIGILRRIFVLISAHNYFQNIALKNNN
jgi:hypothetical protein